MSKPVVRFISKEYLASLDDPRVIYDHIIVGTWGGMPNYGCPCCMIDSLDRDWLYNHMSVSHVQPALELKNSFRSGIGLFDPQGKLIK